MYTVFVMTQNKEQKTSWARKEVEEDMSEEQEAYEQQ